MDCSLNIRDLDLIGFLSSKRFWIFMSDRIHFLISSSLVCSMIGFVLWIQKPPSSQLRIPHETLAVDHSQASLIHFLDLEEGETKAAVDRPFSSHHEEGKRKKYIPLNVVPESTQKQLQQNLQGESKSATPKKRAISQKLKRHLQQTEKNANQLILQNSDSFRRGLLPLVDYSLALNIAFNAKIEASQIRQIKRAKVSLLGAKQKLIQEAVEQLQNFNQPASQGWYGDLVHAKLLLARTNYQIAKELENRDAQQIALGQIAKNSESYFLIRKSELQVGEADLSEYRRAIVSVHTSNQEQSLFFGREQENEGVGSDFIHDLNGIKSEVEWMASQGAGLGRSDLLEFSKAQLTYAQGNFYQKKNQKEKSRQLFAESMKHAKAAWSERINEYYPHGTASLHDLASSWIMWKASEAKYAELESSNRSALEMGVKAGLDRMVNVADRIRDRRGRIAGDISLIHCLKDSEILTELKRP